MNHRRFVLRDLPLSSRLTLALFLIAVGLGYSSAMLQLHLQHASAGEVLPSNADVVRHFHGSETSALKQLLEADESRPFNGSGSMAAAFTKRSGGWAKTIKDRPEADVRLERDGERLAVLAWVAAGAPKAEFEADSFPLPATVKAITPEYKVGDAVKLKTVLTERCTRCHAKEGDDEKATSYPLETYEQFQKYAVVEPGGGRVSIEKLTQSTHAHALSFAVLFCLTGLCFSLTSYPGIIRVVLAPIVLLAQIADIGCWWLARLDGNTGVTFALMIPITGGIVGGGLMLQIVLTLLHLFSLFGRIVLCILFAFAAYGGQVVKQKYFDPMQKARVEQVKH